jgi:glycosyltransferase involved in cell wall biosynthesis
MIIGINTLFLIPNRVGGTEYHTRSFLRHLEKQDKENFYVIFCNKENFDTFEFRSKKWKKILCPINASSRLKRILYEQIVFPFTIVMAKCNLLHSFGYFGPILGNIKKIVTIHDTNWKDCPDDSTPFQIFIMNILISLNILLAKKIITISEFSKSRLIHYFPAHRKKFFVIPNAIEDDFIELLKKNDKPVVDGKYLFCVSKFYPHKKIPYLVSLFKEIEEKDKSLKLVLVGRDGKDENIVLKMIKNDNKIVHFDKVKYPDLVNLYKNAKTFVFPSIYEGFGYPVYEAAAAGLPIFVGNKELYSKAYQDVIDTLSFDKNVDSHNILNEIRKKQKATMLFSYKKSVSMLIDAYQEINAKN